MLQTSPQPSDGRSVDFYKLCTPATAWLCSLQPWVLLSVSGPDSGRFLQGQTTNNVDALNKKERQLSGYCNPKGRLIAVFHVLKMDDQSYQLQVHRSVADTVYKRMAMYKLRAQLNLEPQPPSQNGLGLIGEDADQMIADVLSVKPPAKGQLLNQNGCTLINESGFCSRYAVYADADLICDLRRQWSANSEEKPDAVWRLHRIMDGLPTIYPETGETLTPQMVNLDLAGGLSFSKGCYPGQEVVARTHYLGQLKRRMYLFDCGLHEAAPGNKVFVPQFSEQQVAGTVVDAAPLDNQRTVALLSARLMPEEPCPEVHLHKMDGTAIERLPLRAYKIDMTGRQKERST